MHSGYSCVLTCYSWSKTDLNQMNDNLNETSIQNTLSFMLKSICKFRTIKKGWPKFDWENCKPNGSVHLSNLDAYISRKRKYSSSENVNEIWMNRFLEFHFAIKVRMDFPAQLHLHLPEFWGSEKRTEREMNNLLPWAPLALKAIYGSEIVPIQLCQQSQLLPLAILVIGMGQMPRWHKLLFELLEKFWVWMFWIENWNVFINLKRFVLYYFTKKGLWTDKRVKSAT